MSKLFTPVSLIAEYAGDNVSNSITLLEKEESLTSIFLAHEYSMSKAENEYNMRNWKMLVENAQNPYMITEGVLSSISEFFKKIFEAITEFFAKLFSSKKSKLTDAEIKDEQERFKKNAENKQRSLDREQKKNIVIENIAVAKIMLNFGPSYKKYIQEYEKTLIQCIIDIENAMVKASEDFDNVSKELTNNLHKNRVGLNNNISFMNFNALKNPGSHGLANYIYEEDGKYKFDSSEYRKSILDSFGYAKFDRTTYLELEDKGYLDIEYISKSIEVLNDYEVADGNEIKRAQNAVISKILEMESKISKMNYDGKVNNMLTDAIAKLRSLASYGASAVTTSASTFKTVEAAMSNCKRIVTSNINSLKTETVQLHGVEIDSDSMFDDEIIRDFNTSTWMDLALESNYSLMKKFDMMDLEHYYRECVSMARPISESARIKEIRIINEAVAKKLVGFVKNAIDTVKKLFSKFIETLTANLRSNKVYLDKYRKIILTQTPKQQQIKMKDCFESIKRITSTTIPPFDYNQIKDRFDTEEDAQKWIKEKLPVKNDSTLNGIEDFATWCKAYFCIADESPIKIYEMSNSNSINMTDIFNFCHDNTKITNQCKTMLSNLEKNANNIAAAAELAANNLSTQQNSPQEQNASAVYSFVYGKPIREVEIVKNDGDSTSANNTPSSNRASDNMPKTAADNDPNAAANNIKSAGTNEELQAIKNKTINYVKAVKIFFAAELTAIEFVQKEFMSLIRMHVKNFVDDETQGTAAKSVGTDYKKK